jgi:hypothetical protein
VSALPLMFCAELVTPTEPASDLTWRLILQASARAGDADDDDARARCDHAARLYHDGQGHIACLAPLNDSDMFC